MALVRSLCKKTGIQLLAREYAFDADASTAVRSSDILNVFPLVKHVPPEINRGRLAIQEGKRLYKVGQVCIVLTSSPCIIHWPWDEYSCTMTETLLLCLLW